MREQQRHNIIEFIEFADAQSVGQLAQDLDALVMLRKTDAHGLALQLFQLEAADAVHLRVGLAEEADRVVHERVHGKCRVFRGRHQGSLDSLPPLDGHDSHNMQL